MMKYITANEDVFLCESQNKDCSLTIRSGQQGEVEISTDSQEIGQIGMALLIEAVEVGVDDVDSYTKFLTV